MIGVRPTDEHNYVGFANVEHLFGMLCKLL